MTDPRPLMRTEEEDGRVVVRLAGEIDLSNVDGLEAQIDGAIAHAQDARKDDDFAAVRDDPRFEQALR